MGINDFVIDGRKDNGKLFDRFKSIPFIKKLLTVKHISTYLVVAGILLLLSISLVVGSSVSKPNVSALSSTAIEQTEIQLSEVLSGISGAGKVKVMISYEGGMKKVIAYDTTVSNDKTNSDGRETEYQSENKSPVTVSVSGASSPLVLQELKPQISGVIVVAQGADNLRVRLNLLSAVKTVLNISSEKVEVFTMNN